MPYHRFGLERLPGVRQEELDRDPLTQLEFRRQHRGHAAFPEIERTSRNAGRRARTKHRDIDRDGHRITWNAPANPAEPR